MLSSVLHRLPCTSAIDSECADSCVLVLGNVFGLLFVDLDCVQPRLKSLDVVGFFDLGHTDSLSVFFHVPLILLSYNFLKEQFHNTLTIYFRYLVSRLLSKL